MLKQRNSVKKGDYKYLNIEMEIMVLISLAEKTAFGETWRSIGL